MLIKIIVELNFITYIRFFIGWGLGLGAGIGPALLLKENEKRTYRRNDPGLLVTEIPQHQ